MTEALWLLNAALIAVMAYNLWRVWLVSKWRERLGWRREARALRDLTVHDRLRYHAAMLGVPIPADMTDEELEERVVAATSLLASAGMTAHEAGETMAAMIRPAR